MKPIFFLTILLGLIAQSSQAQTNTPYRTLPPLAEVLPIDFKDGRVQTLRAFPANLEHIVPTRSILRTFYARPNGLEEARVSDSGRSISDFKEYQRQTRQTDSQIMREKSQWRKLATENVWDKPGLFRAAVETIDARPLRLVYLDPTLKKDLNASVPYEQVDLPEGFCDEPFQLPEGLFLADGPSGVEVLAVEIDSPSARAGIRAGDLFRRIGDKEIKSLAEWLKEFPVLKSQVKSSGHRQLPFALLRAGQEVVCGLPLQLALQGGILDLPVETTGPSPTPTPR
jgi:hypothetical protein